MQLHDTSLPESMRAEWRKKIIRLMEASSHKSQPTFLHPSIDAAGTVMKISINLVLKGRTPFDGT
jgi:hypothetical protein